MNGTLSSLKIKKDKMKLNTNTNFSTVTELADELVKKEKLSFRVAHQIVGKVVSECVEKGIDSDGITIEMINDAGKTYASRTFDWTQDDVNKLLNATYSVENKLSLGSPSQKESANSISKLEKGLDKDVQVYEYKINELEQSKSKLFSQIDLVLDQKF